MRMNKILNPISKLAAGKGKLNILMFCSTCFIHSWHISYCDHENRGYIFILTYHSQ